MSGQADQAQVETITWQLPNLAWNSKLGVCICNWNFFTWAYLYHTYMTVYPQELEHSSAESAKKPNLEGPILAVQTWKKYLHVLMNPDDIRLWHAIGDAMELHSLPWRNCAVLWSDYNSRRNWHDKETSTQAQDRRTDSPGIKFTQQSCVQNLNPWSTRDWGH